MKNVVLRMACTLTLLLILGAVFGSADSRTEHAATGVIIYHCDGAALEVYSSTAGTTCFANTGSTAVTIPNVYGICSRNYSGYAIMTNGAEYTFGASDCFTVNNQTLEYLHLGF